MIKLSLAALTILAVCFAAPLVQASGGGGSMSAPSGPSIDPQAAYRAGVAALQAHNYRDAISNFRNVLSVAPNEPTTNYLLGVSLIGNQDARSARRPLERATHDSNAPADAWLQLGLIYLQQGDRDKAQAQLTALTTMIAACDATCGDTRRAELQTAHDALDHALTAPAAAPANPTTGWLPPGEGAGRAAYAEAVGLINTQHYADALASLARARAAIGPHPDIFNYMGFASRKLGRFDDALRYYGLALEIDPRHLGANEYLGELYLQMGRRDDARRQLALLDHLCPYGCAQREELAHWMVASR